MNPKSYGENVIVSYDVISLNPATVLIVEMAAYKHHNFNLTIADNYDENVTYLFKNIDTYIFVFPTISHCIAGLLIYINRRKQSKYGHKKSAYKALLL